jgi:hypothetical protein
MLYTRCLQRTGKQKRETIFRLYFLVPSFYLIKKEASGKKERINVFFFSLHRMLNAFLPIIAIQAHCGIPTGSRD